MQKRGFADHFSFGNFDNDPFGSQANAGDWSLIVAPTAEVFPPGGDLDVKLAIDDGRAPAAPIFADGSGYAITSEAPDAFGAGGKKGSGGGTTTGGGTST